MQGLSKELRFELVSELFPLGMTAGMLAKYLIRAGYEVSEASLINDIRKLGGAKAFPDRPKFQGTFGKQRQLLSAALVKKYAEIVINKGSGFPPSFWDGPYKLLFQILSHILDVFDLQPFLQGMESMASRLMCPYAGSDDMNRLKFLKGLYPESCIGWEAVLQRNYTWRGDVYITFEYYLQKIISGEFASSGNLKKDFTDYCADAYAGKLVWEWSAEATMLMETVLRNKLTPREFEVVTKHQGLGIPKQTFESLALDFEVQPKRVRQIETKAFRKLRHSSVRSKLDLLMKTGRGELVQDALKNKLAEMGVSVKQEEVSVSETPEERICFFLDSNGVTTGIGDELFKKLCIPVDELESSVRLQNTLVKAGWWFGDLVGDLVQRDEKLFLRIKNSGRKQLSELKELLQALGFPSMGLKFSPALEKRFQQVYREEYLAKNKKK